MKKSLFLTGLLIASISLSWYLEDHFLEPFILGACIASAINLFGFMIGDAAGDAFFSNFKKWTDSKK